MVRGGRTRICPDQPPLTYYLHWSTDHGGRHRKAVSAVQDDNTPSLRERLRHTTIRCAVLLGFAATGWLAMTGSASAGTTPPPTTPTGAISTLTAPLTPVVAHVIPQPSPPTAQPATAQPASSHPSMPVVLPAPASSAPVAGNLQPTLTPIATLITTALTPTATAVSSPVTAVAPVMPALSPVMSAAVAQAPTAMTALDPVPGAGVLTAGPALLVPGLVSASDTPPNTFAAVVEPFVASAPLTPTAPVPMSTNPPVRALGAVDASSAGRPVAPFVGPVATSTPYRTATSPSSGGLAPESAGHGVPRSPGPSSPQGPAGPGGPSPVTDTASPGPGSVRTTSTSGAQILGVGLVPCDLNPSTFTSLTCSARDAALLVDAPKPGSFPD